MSHPRSESATTDPLRPPDHIDSVPDERDLVGPSLGLWGWLRWGWRQLANMRTALILLLLLALAAIPGSIVPQRAADPNGVTQYFQANPTLAPILDKFQLFNVYTSVWFSSIYILLFISLIGCIIPRTKHHLKALRARPPRTPARLGRLADHRESIIELTPGTNAQAEANRAIDLATAQLRSSGYRVERYDRRGVFSVSAERGYLRESGNLLFHIGLVGLLIVVGIGAGFAYTGQRVLVDGTTFVNSVGTDYSSFNPGRFVNPASLTPYTMKLTKFDVTYQPMDSAADGQAGDFAAHVVTAMPGQEATKQTIRVNHPLHIAGEDVYLMGNGYAPTITVRNPQGKVVFHDDVPFLPENTQMMSLGIVKVPDGLAKQIGLVGYFYPTQVSTSTGAFASAYPALVNPVLSMNVYQGNLGLNGGIPQSVYALDTSGMTQLTGGRTGVKSIELAPGQTQQLPDGLGSVTFGNEAPAGAKNYDGSVKPYVSLQMHRDAAAPWILVLSLLTVASLMVALFVPRRRLWVKATPDSGTVRLEYAGLARGEDPTLSDAVAALAARHGAAFDSGRSAGPVGVDGPSDAPAQNPRA